MPRAGTSARSGAPGARDAAADPSDIAAGHLVMLRRAERRGDRLPLTCRPTDLQAAFAIQRRVGTLLDAKIGGWKCALPIADKTIAAPIYASSICDRLPWKVRSELGAAQVEPELAFVLGRHLPQSAAPYSLDILRSAIAHVRLALELLGCRYANPSAVDFLELFADGLFNDGLFLGPEIEAGTTRELAACEITIDAPDGRLLRHNGRHPDGDPLIPFRWLANFLAERGISLAKGQVIITGSYAGVIDLPIGKPLRIGFGEFGGFSVELSSME